MQLIDGKATAMAIKQEIAQRVKEIVANGGKQPHLAAILVGHDGGSETYVAAKVKACGECGFKSSLIRFESDVTEEDLLNKVQEAGHEIGIISWTSKAGTPAYNERVAEAKKVWLGRHLQSVAWNEIKVVAYGTDKRVATGGGILFDDEEGNRINWGVGAYEPKEIVEILKNLLKKG